MALRSRCWVWCDGPMFICAEVRLDADIKHTRTRDNVTVLAVCGVYRPPLRGRAPRADRAVIRRVSPAAIRTFTHRICAAVTDPASSPEMAGTDLLPGFAPWPEPEDCDHNRHGVSNP